MSEMSISAGKRIHSIDILRGLVMVIMAIDHIRDSWALTPFVPEDMSQTTPGLFFTRWITHFCAPTFVFLAGTAAFLYFRKVKDKKKLSSFLLSRGIWLIIVEFFIMNLIITFEIPFTSIVFVQVIWAIGISMIALAGLVHFRATVILIISLVMIAGHNLLDPVSASSFGSFSWAWILLHEQSFIPISSGGLFVVYPIIPWIGVMGAGFVFGNVLKWEAPRRKKFLLRTGVALVMVFVILRLINLYGDPSPWNIQKNGLYTFMDFLNTTKYPPSLLFLCMTIGPALLLLVPLEHWSGKISNSLRIIGRVPFFYYIVHFFLIHLTSVITYSIIYGRYVDLMNTMAVGTLELPESYQPRLWVVYVVWAILLIPLFYLCKWYNEYKFTHPSWWIKYL